MRTQMESNRSVEERLFSMLQPLMMPIMGELAEGVARRLSGPQVDAFMTAARVRMLRRKREPTQSPSLRYRKTARRCTRRWPQPFAVPCMT